MEMDPMAQIAQQQAQLQQQQQQMANQDQQIQQLTQQLAALVAQVANIPPPAPPPAAPVPQAPAPKLPKPSLFTGERAPSTLQPWLVQVKTHLAATPNLQLNSQQAVNVAAAYLGGSALIWYDTVKTANHGQTPYTGWEQFATAIMAHYLPYNRFDNAFSQLRRLKQQTSALQYVSKFNELMLALEGMDPHTQKQMFLGGLKPSVREAVEMQSPEDLQAAQQLAVRADTIQFQTRKSQQPHRPAYTPAPSSGPTPMELGAHSGESSSGEFNSLRCYNCNEEGHMTRDCPKPQRQQGGRGRGRGRFRGGRFRGRGRGGSNNTSHGAPN